MIRGCCLAVVVVFIHVHTIRCFTGERIPGLLRRSQMSVSRPWDQWCGLLKMRPDWWRCWRVWSLGVPTREWRGRRGGVSVLPADPELSDSKAHSCSWWDQLWCCFSPGNMIKLLDFAPKLLIKLMNCTLPGEACSSTEKGYKLTTCQTQDLQFPNLSFMEQVWSS